MEPLKTRGLRELDSLRRRVLRARSLRRITTPDADFLLEKMAEMEVRIVSMVEHDKDGEEVGRGW